MDAKDLISSGLLELYVLGMASDQEMAEVIAMSKNYPEIAAEIKAIELSMESYAQANAIRPAASLKQKIFANLDTSSAKDKNVSTTEITPVVSIWSGWKYAAAAAIFLLVGSIVMNIVYYNKYKTANNDYAAAEREKNKVQDQLFAMQQSNEQMKNDMNVVQSKYSEPVSLRGLEAAPDAAAKIFWMKNTGDVYIDPSNLPDAPSGMQYQLWAIVEGKPVDGGMIVMTKKGDKYRIQKMKSFGKADAFAVTLETEGGNPTPKGKMYVMGKM